MNNSVIERPIYGVYFCCCIGNYLEVVEEQLKCMCDVQSDNLYKKTKQILFFVCLYVNTSQKLNDLVKKYDTNDKFKFITTEENLYEKYAINNYKKHIEDPSYYLYYMHTKGVSHDINKQPIFTNIRQILNFYTITKHKINIKLLEKYDAVGCSLSIYPVLHFSGNFWWAKSEYLNKLEDCGNEYLDPEMYIGAKSKINKEQYIAIIKEKSSNRMSKLRIPLNRSRLFKYANPQPLKNIILDQFVSLSTTTNQGKLNLHINRSDQDILNNLDEYPIINIHCRNLKCSLNKP